MPTSRDVNKKRHFPYVTVTLCTAMIIIFVSGLFFPELYDILTNRSSKVMSGQYWAFVTSSLTHAKLWHLMLNVPIILYLGYKVEGRWGSLVFVVIALLSSLASDAFFMMVYMMNGYSVSVLGASGIKCGLLGFCISMFLFELLSGKNEDVQKAFWGFAPIFVIAIAEVILSFFPGIAWAAHVGGAGAGVLVAAIVFFLDHSKTRKTILQ